MSKSEPPFGARRFRLYLSGSYAGRSAERDQLAIAITRRDAAGMPTWRIAEWIDLASLGRSVCPGGAVILEGEFAQPADIRLACVIEHLDVVGRLQAAASQATAVR